MLSIFFSLSISHIVDKNCVEFIIYFRYQIKENATIRKKSIKQFNLISFLNFFSCIFIYKNSIFMKINGVPSSEETGTVLLWMLRVCVCFYCRLCLCFFSTHLFQYSVYYQCVISALSLDQSFNWFIKISTGNDVWNDRSKNMFFWLSQNAQQLAANIAYDLINKFFQSAINNKLSLLLHGLFSSLLEIHIN